MPFKMNLLTSPGGMNRSKTKHLFGVLTYFVAALCLYWVFRKVDLHSFVHQFQVLSPGYLCVAIALNTAVYFANSLRWSILLRPLAKVSFRRAVQAVYIGLYFNEILPLRPGELIRCYLLSRWGKLPLSNVFASAAIERILDGLWMLAGFFAVAIAIKLPRSLVSGAMILAVCVMLITCAWMIHAARARARRNLALQPPGKTKTGFLDALEFMGHTRVAIAALAVSGLSLACLILAMWFLMKGGGVELSLAEAAAVLLIIRVGTVIPNAPGNIGSYQFFSVLAMGLFGVNKSAAVAFSLLIYSTFTVPLLIGGTIAFVASGLKFKTLLAAAES
jgi:uncharacterized membrane protein YbhN (UPF0104 family)